MIKRILYQFDLDIPAGQQALGRMLAFIGAIVQPR